MKRPITTVGQLRLGDTITFRAACRWGKVKTSRKVNGFWNGQPTVRFGGWSDFVVRAEEILTVQPKA